MKTPLFLLLVAGAASLFSPVQAQDYGLEKGLDAGITYTADLFTVASGGRDQGVRFLDNLDIELRLDTDSTFGWGGAEVFLYGLGNQGGSVSSLAGDLQGLNNIEAESSWRIYEAWIQKYFLRAHTSVLAGLYDLNSEFDVIHTALLFINSSHGIGPDFALSGELGPSIFPYTSFGARIKSNPFPHFIVKLAALDGIPSNPENTDGTKIFFRKRDGLLLAGEISLFSGKATTATRGETVRLRSNLSRNFDNQGKYRLSIGGWYYTRKRPGWSTPNSGRFRDRGIYVLGEYRFFNEAEDPLQGLSGFLRVGLANERINPLSGYLGTGLSYTGLLGGRPRDQLGLAVALPFISSDLETQRALNGLESDSFELNIEATYRLLVRSFSFLQLDLQYIVHPNMNPDIDHALAFGTRIQISL